MALVLDPRTGLYVEVPDNSAAARLQTAAQQSVIGPRGPLAPLSPPTPASAAVTPDAGVLAAQGRQMYPPAAEAGSDVPAYPGQTWPLEPLALSTNVLPADQQATRTARTSADLAGVNQGIADALQAARPQQGIMQPAQRGNYNMYNTNAAALPKPQSAGINFGFGVNGAPSTQQVLAQYAVADQQAALAQRERVQASQQQAQLSRLQDAKSDPVAFRQQLRILQATQPDLVATRQQQADSANETLRNRTAAQTAGLNAATTLQGQAMANQGRLMAADLTGQYGLAAADLRTQVALDKINAQANTPAARKAAAEAALLETQLNAIGAGVEAGQLSNAQVIAATRSGQEGRPQTFVNPITGAPLSPEEIALLQQQQLRQLQPAQ